MARKPPQPPRSDIDHTVGKVFNELFPERQLEREMLEHPDWPGDDPFNEDHPGHPRNHGDH